MVFDVLSQDLFVWSRRTLDTVLTEDSAVCSIVCLSLQGPLMDFSKRSRSGKFRLVPKFKKDKNNKNKEMCATLSLPGESPPPQPAVSLRVASTWSSITSVSVCLCLLSTSFLSVSQFTSGALKRSGHGWTFSVSLSIRTSLLDTTSVELSSSTWRGGT